MSPVLLVVLAACSGGSSEVKAPAEPTASAVPAGVVAQTWQVRLAPDAARASFEGRPSWTAYFGGNRADALRAMVSENDPDGLARLQAELGALYWGAAALEANALEQAYEADAEPTDPAETHALLALSHRITGAPEGDGLAAAKTSKVPGFAAKMAAYAGGDATMGGKLPASAGDDPLPGADLKLFDLPLQGEAGTVDLGDPMDLVALACAHAGPGCPVAKDGVVAPADPSHVADAWLFLSPYTSGEDLAFLKALPSGAPAAVDAWADKSAYAAIVKHCRKDTKVDPDCVLDEAMALGKSIEAGMKTASGKDETFYRAFADLARAGALRAAERVAEVEGDDETMGRLRLLALDRSLGAARDPVYLMRVAAWDAHNRNSPRAEELVHELDRQFPGLHVARSALDVLHVRLSRNAAPGLPSN